MKMHKHLRKEDTTYRKNILPQSSVLSNTLRHTGAIRFLPVQEQNEAAGQGDGDHDVAQDGVRDEAGEFRAEKGADGKARQRLEEDGYIHESGGEVTKAAGNGDGEDNHHGGADGVIEGDAKEQHEANLDESGGADAKGAGEKAGDEADEDGADDEGTSHGGGLIAGDIIGDEGGVKELEIEKRRRGEQDNGEGGR